MRISKRRGLLLVAILMLLVFNFFWSFYHHKNQKLIKWSEVSSLYEENGDDDDKEFRNMIKYMFQIGAFLVDVNYLNELVNETHSTVSEKLSTRSFFNRDQYMAFGLIADNFSIFHYNDFNRFNMTCNITKTKGHLVNKTVNTNIYFKCPNAKVQVSLFHERGEYLWIGQDEKSEQRPSWFGDTPRAVQKIEKEILTCYKNDLIYIPARLKKFLYDYQHSKFYECNHEIANEMKIQLKENHTKSDKELSKFKYGLRAFSELLEGLYKPYIINSGTLLGWYRHCNIIPHTIDVDFSIRLDDYDVNIKKSMLGNRKIHLIRTFGTPKNGLEFRSISAGIQFDLFFLTNLNETHWWTGYHFPTKYYKHLHRRFSEFCSCDLLGIKLLIPCEPEKTLVHNYGPNWSRLVYHSGWANGDPQVYKYDNEELKDKLRIYDQHGKFKEQESIDYINYYNHSIRITKIIDDMI